MKARRQQQIGIISIMVTMIMMIVISLIVLGFAEVSRNEQRGSLDDQLSVQAYYAAESGINDARAAIATQLASSGTVRPKTYCGSDSNYTSMTGVVDPANGVSYTCVLIKTDLATLSYKVGASSTVIPMISSAGSFGQLTLSWSQGSGLGTSTAGCTTGNGFPPATKWSCNYPLLRVDIVDAQGTLSRNWSSNTATMFFVPAAVGGAASVGLGTGATIVQVPCSVATGTCTINLRNVNSDTLYMRATTLYRSNALLTISSTPGKTFSGAQAQIDATGKAQDVLRRVLVAVDLMNISNSPSAALITQDSVCKRFGVTNGSFDVPLDGNLNNPIGAAGDNLCVNQTLGTPAP